MVVFVLQYAMPKRQQTFASFSVKDVLQQTTLGASYMIASPADSSLSLLPSLSLSLSLSLSVCVCVLSLCIVSKSALNREFVFVLVAAFRVLLFLVLGN